MPRSFDPLDCDLQAERDHRISRDFSREPRRHARVVTPDDYAERSAMLVAAATKACADDDEPTTTCSCCARDGLDLTNGACDECIEIAERIAARNKAEADWDDHCDRLRKERAEEPRS